MNIMIVEDEQDTAALLREFIEMNEGYQVVYDTDSIEGAVAHLEKYQRSIDLLFLDIHLADGMSFDIFEKVEINVPVVFCTAYDEYALQAFQLNGIGYILKPFKEKDISEVFGKVGQIKSKWNKDPELNRSLRNAFSGEPDSQAQSSFVVKYRDKMIPVSVKDIAMVVLDNQIVYLYNFKGEKYPVFKTMDQIEAVLDTKDFFRVNRQMIVHRNAIMEMESYFNRKLLIKPKIAVGEKVIVSRLKVSPFLAWVESA